MIRLLLFAFCCAGPQLLIGQALLSIEQIMQGPDFVGHLPSQPKWSLDGKSIYFRWNPDNLPMADWYKYDLKAGSYHKVSVEEERRMPESPIYSRDRKKVIYQKNGDIFLVDMESSQLTQITNTVERESRPQFSGDEQFVLFQRENNLYQWEMKSGALKQLTDFRKGHERKDPELSAQAAWLKRDQLEYFQILRERSEAAEYQEDKNDMLAPERPREIYLGDAQLWAIQPDPKLDYIVYQLAIAPKENQGTMVPDYVTEMGYVEELSARSKVGSPQGSYSTWIYHIARDTHFQIDPLQIPGIYDKPDYYRDYTPEDSVYVDTFADARSVSILGPVFSDSGERAVVVVRSQDHKDRWIMSLDPTDGTLDLIDRQTDQAWIGGPGVGGWSLSMGSLGWIDEESFWFQSEETGYAHLYRYSFATKEKSALTSGPYEILQADLSNDRLSFFLHASKEGPFEQHFYKLPVAGGALEKITELAGRHFASISPDEQQLAVLFSYSNQPTELFVQENTGGAPLQQITHSTTDEFNEYPWRDPEIVHFKARDGKMVPARIYTPEAEKKNGAAVIFVHGAGYLHNVHKWWSSYYREYMFHNLLADEGYTVLDIDYRASAGYGRDWRTAIYRHMGGKDLTDQLDGARYLIESHTIDADRLGIYGGSYGGFITLMALCTAPGTFKCGAALRSVTDWAHYNHGYTSRILNTPVEDSIAYYRSSPIYHAEHLEGDLIMLHGMVDRNVQFQDVVRMTQRFIEAGKKNFELAVFPMEDHGFVESSSWADEYRRIFELFERNLAKPSPH